MKLTKILVKVEYLLQALIFYFRKVGCPYCGNEKRVVIARKKILVRICQCNSCGLYFTEPLYTTWLSNNFYDVLYQAEGSTTTIPDVGHIEKLKDENFAGTDKDFNDRIISLNKLFSMPRPRLLELGSSWGYFLCQAKSHGFQVDGVEIGDSRRKYGIKNLDVNIVEKLSNVNDDYYDLVYTAHTLEHFTDLSSVLGDLSKKVKIGGYLCIEVPNFDYNKKGSKVLSLIGAIHPIGFDSNFFINALEKHSFSINGIWSDWDTFGMNNSDYSYGDVVIVLATRV